MSLNPFALLPLSGFVVNVALAVAVLARSPRARPNRIYALLCFALAYWSLLKFALRLSVEPAAALILFELSSPGWCLLPSLYLHFVMAITHPERPRATRPMRALHGLGLAFAATAFVPGAMVRGMINEPWGYSHVPGPVFTAFSVFLIGTFTAALVLLTRARLRSTTASVRTQYGFVAVGVVFPLLGGIVTNMLLPIAGIHVLELGEVLSSVNAGVIAYAMSRHGLLAVSLEQAGSAIIETMGDSLLVINVRGEVVLTNPATTRLLGLAAKEMLGRPVYRFVRTEMPEGQDLTRTSKIRVGDGEYLPPGGDPIPVVISASPIRDSDGELVGTVWVARDMRELRKMLSELETANHKLEAQAITDELTGLANRRFGNKRLAEEFARATRNGTAVSIAVVDLDDFKQINDRFGHLAGDGALRAVAAALRATVRSSDVVARWGGDEFFVLWPDTDAETAHLAGERILAAICGASAPGLEVTMRASLGIATLDPSRPIADPESLVKVADDALYRVKRDGKGRVSSDLVKAPETRTVDAAV